MSAWATTPVDRCANLECPNRAHEGAFVLTTSVAPVVTRGVRHITLLLCAPCADGLHALVGEK